ncbi:hypothetical protein GGI58_000283 [Rhizobium lentis]|nr:hypothetical protein [Rhizobium lentis]MBB5565192.1 hypothetical protein [Rhizobium lentis]
MQRLCDIGAAEVDDGTDWALFLRAKRGISQHR